MERLFLSGLRRRLLRHARGRILEVGFGTGLNLIAYDRGGALVGLEASEAMLYVARGKEVARRETVRLLQGDALRLPFPNEVFDTVAETFTLCTVDEPEGAVAEMVRVLKPGGRLLMMDHGLSRAWPLAVLQRRLARWQFRRCHCRLDLDMRGLYESVPGVRWRGIESYAARLFVLGFGQKVVAGRLRPRSDAARSYSNRAAIGIK